MLSGVFVRWICVIFYSRAVQRPPRPAWPNSLLGLSFIILFFVCSFAVKNFTPTSARLSRLSVANRFQNDSFSLRHKAFRGFLCLVTVKNLVSKNLKRKIHTGRWLKFEIWIKNTSNVVTIWIPKATDCNRLT